MLGTIDELHAGELPPFLRAQRTRFSVRLAGRNAETELRNAARLFDETEMPFYAAATRLEYAERLLSEGRADEARPLLDQVREMFERLDARPWLERTDAAAGVPA